MHHNSAYPPLPVLALCQAVSRSKLSFSQIFDTSYLPPLGNKFPMDLDFVPTSQPLHLPAFAEWRRARLSDATGIVHGDLDMHSDIIVGSSQPLADGEDSFWLAGAQVCHVLLILPASFSQYFVVQTPPAPPTITPLLCASASIDSEILARRAHLVRRASPVARELAIVLPSIFEDALYRNQSPA